MVRQRTANPLSPVRIWVPPPADNPAQSVMLKSPAKKRGFCFLTVRRYPVNIVCIRRITVPIPVPLFSIMRRETLLWYGHAEDWR